MMWILTPVPIRPSSGRRNRRQPAEVSPPVPPGVISLCLAPAGAISLVAPAGVISLVAPAGVISLLILVLASSA
eukprot:3968068-Pyramimonas_sp.AAC.1